MKRFWWALLLLIPMALYVAGLAHGRPRPEYNPSTTQNAWLNPATVYHPDAFAFVGIAYRMLLRDDWNPHYYHNPPVNIYTNIALFWASGAEGMPHNKTYDDRAIAPFQLYVMAQYMSALYMLVSVVLTYAAGRTAFNRRAGMIAAAGVALSPLVVQHAHYATPNAQTLMISTAALLVGLVILKNEPQRRRERGDSLISVGAYGDTPLPERETQALPLRKRVQQAASLPGPGGEVPAWALYGIGGLLVGLTMATRYNAVVVGMITGLAMLTDTWRTRRWLPLIVGVIAMPVGVVIGLPGLIFARQEVIDQVRDILQVYREEGGGDGFTSEYGLEGFYYHWRYIVLIVVGPVMTLAALVGLALTLRRWRSTHWRVAWTGAALAVYVLVYTVMALPGKRIQANLLFPLIVPLALLAGYAVETLWARRRGLGIGLAAVMLIWSGVIAGLFVYRIATPDNRVDAQAWIYEHIPRGTSIHVLEPYNVPLDPLDYKLTVSYARQVTPDRLRAATVQVIVYSDTYPFLVTRDPAVSSARGIAREQAIRDILETDWIELARFERWPWLAEDLPPDDISYWHQMEIVIYCNPAKCPVPHP